MPSQAERVVEKPAYPFLKWAGSKRQLLLELHRRIPSDFGRYFEPFVGGGALFFSLRDMGRRVGDPCTGIGGCDVILNDSNRWLIETYRAIRDNVNGVIKFLHGYEEHYRKDGEKFYYIVRKNAPTLLADRAAAFIFLNKTGFNGLFRVNKSGDFNVPHGKRASMPMICDEDNLRACSEALQGVATVHDDFGGLAAAGRADKGDFVYFDCPYWPVSASADFTAYTKEPFGPSEQMRLRNLALTLKRRGVHVLLSNADVEPVRALYAKGFTVERVEARRAINSDASKRGSVGEVLIT
jgi:DNA adenine methylase